VRNAVARFSQVEDVSDADREPADHLQTPSITCTACSTSSGRAEAARTGAVACFPWTATTRCSPPCRGPSIRRSDRSIGSQAVPVATILVSFMACGDGSQAQVRGEPEGMRCSQGAARSSA
jgi:hypothetical protein